MMCMSMWGYGRMSVGVHRSLKQAIPWRWSYRQLWADACGCYELNSYLLQGQQALVNGWAICPVLYWMEAYAPDFLQVSIRNVVWKKSIICTENKSVVSCEFLQERLGKTEKSIQKSFSATKENILEDEEKPRGVSYLTPIKHTEPLWLLLRSWHVGGSCWQLVTPISVGLTKLVTSAHLGIPWLPRSKHSSSTVQIMSLIENDALTFREPALGLPQVSPWCPPFSEGDLWSPQHGALVWI